MIAVAYEYGGVKCHIDQYMNHVCLLVTNTTSPIAHSGSKPSWRRSEDFRCMQLQVEILVALGLSRGS